MSRFEPVVIGWEGVDFTIPADQVLRAIALIEDYVTFDELQENAQKRTIPLAKLSQAFAAVLRHAGAKVSADDVYAGMFAGGATRDAITASIVALMTMMIPPKHLQREATGNHPAPAGNQRIAASSKPRGKPQSRRSGARR